MNALARLRLKANPGIPEPKRSRVEGSGIGTTRNTFNYFIQLDPSRTLVQADVTEYVLDFAPLRTS